jgi:hypothetical protein
MNSIISIKNREKIEPHKKNTKIEKKYRNVVKKADILCENEIKISAFVMQIPDFFLYFHPIIKYSDFKLAEIDYNRFEKCRVLQNSNKYYLLQYNNREKTIGFNDFFNEKTEKKELIMRMINTNKSLIKMTEILCGNQIVNMNLVPQSIIFNKDNSPILVNLDICFTLEEIEFERKDQINQIKPHINIIFSQYDPRKIHLPPEVHLLCYMNENKYNSLSIANIETVITDWFTSISLSPIGIYISKGLKDHYISSFRNLVNKPKNIIECELYFFAETWNYYSLSIIMLYMISLNQYKLDHIFYMKFVDMCLQNLSSNKNTRKINKMTTFDNLLYSISETEWKSLFY